ncbi:MAG: NAD-binding protein [Planctomycetes bacterium]|nr:NAD-binding protein [Planctomycetota bacterium]
MNAPLRRIRAGGIALVVILVVAVCGYRFLDRQGDRGWLDDLYLVVITISTVGYGEKSTLDPARQIWTIAVILFGLTASGYTIGGLLQLMTEGELQRALGVRRMIREISRLEGHIIICGYGRVGRILSEQLVRQKQAVVVIELNPPKALEAEAAGLMTITGDALEEASLKLAGIDRARVLVTALPGDADNVFLTLTARNLNSKLTIIARGEHPNTQQKLYQAGANQAVMTAAIGARWIATMITRPSAVEFLELISDKQLLDAELDEITLDAGHKMVGQNIGDVVANWPHTLLIVAVKETAGKMTFRPDSKYVLKSGDTVILLGETEAILRLREREGI